MQASLQIPERWITGALAFALSAATSLSVAADLDLADEPLFLRANVAPNVMFIQDDSGSMQFEAMPDDVSSLPFWAFDPQTRANEYLALWAAYGFPRRANGLYGGGDYNTIVPLFDPESIYSGIYRSSQNNRIFYDPERTYPAWREADGGFMRNANVNCAPHNPGRNAPTSGCTGVSGAVARDLNDNNTNAAFWWDSFPILCADYDGVTFPPARDRNRDGSPDNEINTIVGCGTGATRGHFFTLNTVGRNETFYPASYSVFNAANGTGGYAEARFNPANYRHFEIRSDGLHEFNSSGDEVTVHATFRHSGQRTDCTIIGDGVCSYGEEIRNFANWYSYYRSRISTSRAGTGEAFSSLSSDNIRVGYAGINYEIPDDGNLDLDFIKLGVRKFDDDGREDFFDTLYTHTIPNAGTPLRSALQAVGEYYSDESADGPWAEAGFDEIRECRQSYSVLMSDGYWNGDAPSLAGGDNVDNRDGPVITGPVDGEYQYKPAAPYSDSAGNTLADVAMYYWNRDLLPNIDNRVRPNDDDPAFWQHMVTFTVGLGINGDLRFPDALPEIESGTTDWSTPLANSPSTLDDMWHTAINSRGRYFNAGNAAEFAASLTDALSQIEDREGSSGAVSANTGAVSDSSRIYLASFNSANWSGDLRAIPVTSDPNCSDNFTGTLCTTPSWSAAAQLNNQHYDTGREIITITSGGAGTAFRFGSATGALDQAQVNYLRGQRSNEGRASGQLRRRDGVLGDIVNSSPVYEGMPSRIRYPNTWIDAMNDSASLPENGGQTYLEFRTAKQNRDPVILVGANDGMMHIFNADTGSELLGYVPRTLIPNSDKTKRIGAITRQTYGHDFLVDGSPVTNDVYFSGAWHTVAASGLGAGGQAVYALDITGGNNWYDESNAASLALWEFNDSNDSDLGYSFGKPSIVRLHNGRWAAVFGNGYNNQQADGNASATGDAAVFIVDIETGALISKLGTNVGAAEDPLNQGRSNGINSVAPVDIDGDFITDYFYAGDLFGNLWRFDVTDSDPANWIRSFVNKPLFTATDANGTAQAITSAPVVRRHPFGLDHGIVVYFGTGKYIEDNDGQPNTSVTNSMYGIWDRSVDGVDTSLVPGGKKSGLTRADSLQSQTIQSELLASGRQLRIVSDNPADQRHLDWLGGTLGFYMDLKVGASNTGEMIVSSPVLRGELLVFTTLIPGEGDCDNQPESFVMAVDAATGGRFYESPFDLNNDRQFTTDDAVTDDKVYVSGLRTDEGSLGGTNFMVDGGLSNAFLGMVNQEIQTFLINPGFPPEGRRAWRELRRTNP